jgi:16S rRNA (uracil1498-N3)-methyltransferase
MDDGFLTSGQFFYAGPFEGNEYTFDTFESRHIFKVLRKQPGDTVILTGGNGKLYRAVIQTATPNRVRVKILETREIPPPGRKLSLLVAPTKSIDRFEWMLEKTVELGIWEIFPILTRFGERKKINYDRMEKIIISALKQSKRAYKPHLHPLMPLQEAVEKFSHPLFVALCQTGNHRNREYVSQSRAGIIIGPEGGFAPGEIHFFDRNGIASIHLSPNRLRTETAAITATCMFQTENFK